MRVKAGKKREYCCFIGYLSLSKSSPWQRTMPKVTPRKMSRSFSSRVSSDHSAGAVGGFPQAPTQIWGLVGRNTQKLCAYTCYDCCNKEPRTEGLKQQNFIFSQFWGLEVQDKILRGLISSESSLLGMHMAIFLLCLPEILQTKKYD